MEVQRMDSGAVGMVDGIDKDFEVRAVVEDAVGVETVGVVADRVGDGKAVLETLSKLPVAFVFR
jgi:hypothetical protein